MTPQDISSIRQLFQLRFSEPYLLDTDWTFAVNAFILYSSLLTSNGSIYRAEHAYRLKEVP